MTAQLLHHFTPWQPNSYINLPLRKITPSLLHHFTPLGRPTLTSFHPLWTNNPLTLTPFYPPWQSNSYIILHLGSPAPTIFYPSENTTPSLLHHFTPLGRPTLTSFYPLWTNNPLTLSPFYPPWQPNSYIILHLGSPTPTIFYPPKKLPRHCYTILSPLADQLLHHLTPSEQITPSHLHHLTPLADQLLPQFTPSRKINLSLTPFYPPW